MLVCTSFSPAGYDLYGKKCLETFVEFWPCDIVVYHEGEPDFKHEKVIYKALDDLPAFRPTLERMRRVVGSNGMRGGYDYTWDAQKFCRKVFAQDDCFDRDTEVFWLDADSVTHSSVPVEFLRGLIQDVAVTYYGRTSYTETGFIGFNTKHEDFPKFRKNYLAQFTEGKIFQQLKGWHDCIAFDIARQGVKGRDLSPGASGMTHVMATGPTAQFWAHNKGPKRKARAHGG